MLSQLHCMRVSFSQFRVVANRSFSSTVTSSLVKELREKSGAPMLDCKKALMADGINGDLKKALDWLRLKGIARASSQSDRVAMEGLIAINSQNSDSIVLLEVNSETGLIIQLV
eukprot:gene13628-18287_t